MGRRGYGKTTHLRKLLGPEPRVVAWDPMVTPDKPDGQLSMPHRFWSGDDCAEHIRRFSAPSALRCAVHSRDPADFAPIVNALVATGGDAVLAIDEVSTLCKGKHPDPHLAWVLDYGRHYGISVFWTARRPQQVAMLCTSQADSLVVFRTSEGRDVTVLRDRLGDLNAERLPRLARFDFVKSQED